MTVRQRSWSTAAATAAATAEAAAHREEEAGGNPLFARNATGHRTDEDDEEDEEDDDEDDHDHDGGGGGGAKTGLRALEMPQGKPLFFLLLTWVLFIFYILHPSPPISTRTSADVTDDSDIPTSGQTHAPSKNPPANLHLVVPASKPDANLCKVMVSAGILGYPDPVIVNWGETFDDAKYVDGGSHLAKVTGISRYLNSLLPEQDDDIMLMVDGYDIWLQLRPQTLIDRYFAVNKRADERIARELGRAAAEHNIHQEIIFGCQKRCWPWTEQDPPCYAVPFSSLPDDIYGPQTDTDVGYEPNPYLRYRPRFINSGVAMGTVRAMRKLFDQALDLLTWESNMGSDQFIFSHILGDQEIWREALRQDSRNNVQKMKEKLPGGHRALHPFVPSHIEEVRAKAAQRPDHTWEFGIGLDYAMEIGLNTVFAEDDTAWLHWSNGSELALAEQRERIPASHPHGVTKQTALAKDITDTVPPFWTFNHDPKLPRATAWSDVPLFTNIWTGVVPAIIHHNAHRDERKALRETWWNETWYANHSRAMYDAHIWEPMVPVAYAGATEESMRAYWPAERWKGGGRAGPKEEAVEWVDRWLRFEDVCHEFHEEVFRDGKGEWILPDVH